jgi:IPT/TIG domain-containing protein
MATLTSFTPSSATPGQLVTITGTGFTGATAVKFGGVAAIFFRVVNNTTIQAYPNYLGTGTITVTTTAGDVSLDGFTLLLTRVKLTDLPVLGRAATGTDLIYVWDILRGKLCKAPVSALPAGSGGGGGDDTGNIFTALGSPFKVRTGDEIYSYNSGTNSVTITDVRLLGKQDYVVYATDVGNEFENYQPPATYAGITTTADGQVINQSAVNISGSGTGAKFSIKTVANVPVLIIQTVVGTGYTIGDTFSIAALPGLTFTFVSATGGKGNLLFDMDAGSVTIINYELTGNSHVTIYADGVTTTPIQDYIAQQGAQLAKLIKVAAPFLPSLNSLGVLTNPGGLVAWFRPANEIPDGWAEWVPGRGNDLRGQDPSDVYDPSTNPDGLSRANGTQGGSKTLGKLTEDNIPLIQLRLFADVLPNGNIQPTPTASVSWTSNHLNGNQDYDLKKGVGSPEPTLGVSSKFGKADPDALNKSLDPFRIVNFIYSTQTA